jgi:dihydrofolate synthase/folylpolyglutamate synthase
MNYKQAQEYLHSISSIGIVPGLDTIRKLLKELGNPQNDLKLVHIAGTNGKGSVGAFLSYALAASGYRVGRYLSPAVYDDCEKIQVLEAREEQNEIIEKSIDDICKKSLKETIIEQKKENADRTKRIEKKKKIHTIFIEKEAVAGHISRIKTAIEKMTKKGMAHPSPFEIETAMAFLELKERQCDIVVLETGMGGRRDATNIVTADQVECCVFVPISMDHMSFLGNTLEEIAEEKAGIMKQGVPVVSSPQKPEVEKVFERKAKEMRSELFFADSGRAENVVHSLDGIDFIYREDGKKIPVHLSLLGINQIENALTAMETLKILKEKKGYHITEKTMLEGLAGTVWQGRFEVVKRQPLVIVDGAHNEAAAKRLAESLNLYLFDEEGRFLPGGKLIYVMGIFKDKEVEKVIRKTVGLADVVLTVTPDSPRGMSSGELREKVEVFWESVGKRGRVEDCGTVMRGVEIGLELAGDEGAVVVFGSLSLLHEVSLGEK